MVVKILQNSFKTIDYKINMGHAKVKKEKNDFNYYK